MSAPTPLVLNDVSMLRMVRQIAQNSENIYLTQHARQRMGERGITRAQVEYCLRNGSMDEAAHQNIKGHWQCRMQCVHAGDWVRVAVVLEQDDTDQWIVVLTVI